VTPARFELVPAVAPDVTLHVADDRESTHPDEDLIEIGLRTTRNRGSGIAVALELSEVKRLRDALTEVIETPLPGER
jgi:hypothetical protein